MNAFNKYIVVLLINFSGFLFAQNNSEKTNNFALHFGLTEYQTQEQVLNKVVHSGMFPALGFSYTIPSYESLHNISLFFTFNPIKSSYELGAASLASNMNLNYSYTQKISDLRPSLGLWLGPIGGMDYNVSYFENWDESHFYWLTSYYLGFDSRLIYNRSNGAYVTFDMQLPLLALVSRPPDRFLKSEIDPKFSAIVNNMHDNMELTSLNRYFDIKLNIAYTFAGSENFMQSFYWRFRYLNNNMAYSKNVKILTHSLGLVLSF